MSDTMPVRPNETVGQGRGIAEFSWHAAAEKLALKGVVATGMEPIMRRLALDSVQRLIGFWVLWQLEGGFAGLERLGMPRSTIFRNVKQFRESFGEHPDVFVFPGLNPDPEAYLAVYGLPEGIEASGMPHVLAEARTAPAKLPR